jgi:ribosomal protein S20
MTISSVSTGTTASYTPNSQQKDVRNAFKQVADAISNNDLPGAQNALDSLAQLLSSNQQNTTGPGSGTTSGTTASTDPTQAASGGTDISSLIDQIGSALQSGDLDQAKQALQSLQQTAQSSRHHHHHHGGGAGGASAQSASSTTSASTASTSTDPTSIGGVNLTV